MANGNGTSGFLAFVRRWWFLGAAIVGAVVRMERLAAEVEKKADASAVESIQRDLQSIQGQLRDMSDRQRAYFCDGKPSWCR